MTGSRDQLVHPRTRRDGAMMEIRDLAVGYGRKTIVSGLNQDILKGHFVSLLGPNGTGKTTILRTLARLLSPLGGAVYLNGNTLQTVPRKELARTMAVVLTERASPGLITAFEFAAMGRYPYTGLLGRLSAQDRSKVEEALELVNALEISGRYFDQLSDGERQKVVLARALAQEPELILLDEPTLHLDLRHRIEILTILSRFSHEKGATVVVSLHDVDMALKISDLVILVKDGKILSWGPPEEIISEESVARLYDLDTACFNQHLGAMELTSNPNGRKVFVVPGGGTGTQIYRLLSRHGCSVASGVIHENDIDFHVARSIGATIVTERPFEQVGRDSLERSFEVLRDMSYVIDSGFPVGTSNRANLKLVLKAIELHKRVFTLRSRGEARELYGEDYEKLIYCMGPGFVSRAILEDTRAREA